MKTSTTKSLLLCVLWWGVILLSDYTGEKWGWRWSVIIVGSIAVWLALDRIFDRKQ
jgi:hypothetical protein